MDKLKPFEVRCDNGTRQRTWTLEQARKWLPACGPDARIYQHGVLIERRKQG